ncbi:MAG: TrkA family potassium uptake protein [Candidatus Hydrogenedentota bacterium]
MSEFVVIGLSTFGDVLARTLYKLNQEVLVIDRNKEKIQEIKDSVTKAVVADATEKKVLEKFIKGSEATIIVSLGDNIEKNVMITYYLKEMGIKRIYVKATSLEQGKLLRTIGATDVIYPERDMAVRTAETLANPNLLESLPLTNEYAIVEFAVPSQFIGKSLMELKLRNEYGIYVLAVKEVVPEKIIVMPPPDYVFKDSDVLFILGKLSDIDRLRPST